MKKSVSDRNQVTQKSHEAKHLKDKDLSWFSQWVPCGNKLFFSVFLFFHWVLLFLQLATFNYLFRTVWCILNVARYILVDYLNRWYLERKDKISRHVPAHIETSYPRKVFCNFLCFVSGMMEGILLFFWWNKRPQK